MKDRCHSLWSRVIVLVAAFAVMGTSSAETKDGIRPATSFTVTREWKERVLLGGQPALVTGQQVTDPGRNLDFTRYLDVQGRPLPEKFARARQKTWQNIPVVEVAAETRPSRPTATRPAPVSVQAGFERWGASVSLPAPDLTEVWNEDKASAATSKAGWRVGIRRHLPKPLQVIDQAPAPAWIDLADGSRLWNASLRSAGARAVRVRFEDVQLPAGARLMVFNPDQPAETVGPYDVASRTSGGGFWSESIFAERVVIECWVPPGTARGSVSFRVGEITHRYRDGKANPGDEKSGPCHHDVTCYPAWAAAAQGVAGIGVVGRSGEITCSGTLLADNDPGTTLNYFLTASHCIEDQEQADTSEFYWFYQTSICDGVAPSPGLVPRTGGGAELLATMTPSQGTDFTLVRIRNDAGIPAGVTYAGWSTASPSSTEDLTVIHHPGGSHKRISFGRLAGTSRDYWSVVYTSGSTEPGSSGAPLLNADGKLIGQLHGGDASCILPTGTDTYGRFSVTYPVIERWLMNQPVVVANDHWANAQLLVGPNGLVTTSNSGASRETEEPLHAGLEGGRSIWFRWSAPGSGPFKFATTGSGFDTLLAIYLGTGVAKLSPVVSNDDGGSAPPASHVVLNATEGTVYSIAIDGLRGAAGPVVLGWEPLEAGSGYNDDFANAKVIGGAQGFAATSNEDATAEPAEPDHARVRAGRSIWFRWTAPRTQTVSFDTELSDFNTVLTAYTGDTLDSLTVLASNNDIDPGSDMLTSRITFTAQQGAVYHIAVDGNLDPQFGSNESGTVLLVWHQEADPAPPPTHDAFASPEELAGDTGQWSGSNEFATKEDGEPAIEGNAGGASIWYRWTAPASGLATFSTEGSRFDSLLAVFRGTAVSALSLVGSNDDISGQDITSRVTVSVTAGTEYRIAVDGHQTESGVTRMGALQLTWEFCPGCGGNDLFANAQALSGGSGRVYGENASATRESGEPSLAGNTGGKSIWYRWIAPATGPVTVETTDSSFDTLLGVFTGTQMAALEMIDSNDDFGSSVQSLITFEASAGTEYRIMVAGYRFSSGEVSSGSLLLSWTQPAGSLARLTNPQVHDGQLSFSFSGMVGRTYEIESSADLVQWSKAGTVLNSRGTATFTDLEPAQGARFYRTKLAP